MFKFNLDLQLFAEANVQTTELASTGNDLSPEMKTFYSKDLIEMVSANLVHAQFGVKKSIPKNGGKSIEWRKWSSFKKALTPLTEGVTPDGTPVNVGYISKEVKEYGDYTTVSDVLELTAIDNVILEITSKHSENAGITLDTIVRNEIVQGTQVMYAPSVINGTPTEISHRYNLDSNAKLTKAMVKKAVCQLKKMNAPKIDGSYVCIIHPSVASDLTDDPKWEDMHKYADVVTMFKGEIGEIEGCRFVESTEAKIWRGADLSAAARTLTVASLTGSVITISEALTSAEAAALAGRELIIDGVHYDVASAAAGAAGAAKITVDSVPGTNPPANADVIYPGEGGKEGYAAYACLFIGKNAYGTVAIDGGGLEIIVKQKGSSGAADPLNQRSTIGWKCNGFGAKILIPEYIVRVECGASDSDVDTAN